MKRAVRSLIRITAAGSILLGFALAGLAYSNYRLGKSAAAFGVLGAIAVLLGIILYGTSARLAERFTDDFE